MVLQISMFKYFISLSLNQNFTRTYSIFKSRSDHYITSVMSHFKLEWNAMYLIMLVTTSIMSDYYCCTYYEHLSYEQHHECALRAR